MKKNDKSQISKLLAKKLGVDASRIVVKSVKKEGSILI